MALVDRVKNIIVSPKTEWPVIAEEQPDTGRIIIGYVLPLSLIPVIASLIGGGLLARGAGMAIGLVSAIMWFIMIAIGVLVAAFVVDILASSFNSERNFGRSIQLVAYSVTPFLVAGVLNVIPYLGILAFVAGLYGLYLMYLGFPFVKKTPEDKVAIYMIVSVAVLVVVMLIMFFILGAIFLAMGFTAATMM